MLTNSEDFCCHFSIFIFINCLLFYIILFKLKWATVIEPFIVFWWINSLWTMNMNIYLRSSRQQGKERVFDLWKRLMVYFVLFKFLVMTCVVKYLQIMILFVLPKYLGLSGANYAKNLLRAAILVQYFPRLFRFLPLLIGQSPTGFIFESAWANFIINLLIFMLSGHVVGSGWYLFGLQVSKNDIWSFIFKKYKISSSLNFIIFFEFSCCMKKEDRYPAQNKRKKQKKSYLIHLNASDFNLVVYNMIICYKNYKQNKLR